MKSGRKKFIVLNALVVLMLFLVIGCSNSVADDVENYGQTEAERSVVTQGSVSFSSHGAWFESAYAEWKAVSGMSGYNAYYKLSSASSYTAADSSLVRTTSSGYRVDIPGLKGSTSYDVKIVPVKSGSEQSSSASVFRVTTLKYTREGYAFVSGTTTGGYESDGTVASGTTVIYVTDSNKDSVSASVTKSSNTTSYSGLGNIMSARQSAKSTDKLIVRFIGTVSAPDGIDSNSLMNIKTNSNVTFEGIGSDTLLSGWGINVRGSTNVEIRNLAFKDFPDDSVSIQVDNDHVWVHNCDFYWGKDGGGDKAKGDGSCDIKDDSTYITISYNHFHNTGKSSLCGMKSETEGVGFVTYHHNWFDVSGSRHPRVRTYTVHVYNNYFDHCYSAGLAATTGSSIFVENNYFEDVTLPMIIASQGHSIKDRDSDFCSGEEGGIIKEYGNTFGTCGSSITYYNGELEQVTKTCSGCTGYTSARSVSSSTAAEDWPDAFAANSRSETVPSSFYSYNGKNTYNNFDTASGFYSYSVESASNARTTVMNYAGRCGTGSEADTVIDDPVDNGDDDEEESDDPIDDPVDEDPIESGETTSFDIQSLSTGTLSSNTTYGDFTVLATSAKTVKITSSSATYDGTSYTKAVDLGGGADGAAATYRAVKFSAAKGSVITAVVNANAARTLNLSNGSSVVSTYSVGTTASQFSYTVTADGTYYLYSSSSALRIFNVTVTAPAVANVAPSVSLSASSTSVTTNTAVTLNATASDSDGSIASVKFYVNSSLVSTDTSSAYSYSWTPTAAGTYSIYAVATDDDGATATSSTVSVTVTAPVVANVAPTISLTAPSNGASSTVNTGVVISATASDSDGSITDVKFYVNGSRKSTDTSSPYAMTWTPTEAGTYTIYAVATDDDGDTTTTGSVSVTINAVQEDDSDDDITTNISLNASSLSTGTLSSNTTYGDFTVLATSAKTVKITSSSATYDGTSYTKAVDLGGGADGAAATYRAVKFTASAGATITAIVNANATRTLNLSNGSSVVSTYSVGTSASAFTYTTTAAGTYYLYSSSSALRIFAITVSSGTVEVPNVAPSVSLSASSTSVTTNTAVTLNASASDSDGSIASVKFYVNSSLVSTDTSSAYSYSWTPTAAGTYSIYALATDDDGAATSSSVISVTVTAPVVANVAPSISLTAPSNGASATVNTGVVISATASDSDGSITDVKFYVDGSRKSTDSSSPYAMTWTPTAAGTYTIYAVATDDDGDTTTTGSVSVTINAAQETVSTISFNASNLSTGTLSSNTTSGDFTILATSAKTVKVSSSSVTVNGTSYTKALDLGGGADGAAATYRAVKFNASAGSTITVVAAANSSRTLTVSDGSSVIGTGTAGTTAAAFTFTVKTTGTHYVYSGGSAIRIYYIEAGSTGGSDDNNNDNNNDNNDDNGDSSDDEGDVVIDSNLSKDSTQTGVGMVTKLHGLSDTAIANSIYVSPSGSSSGSGTKSSPKDLASAITSVKNGGAIVMMAGTYKYSSKISIAYGNNGSSSAYKYIMPVKGASVTLDFSGESYNSSDTSKNDRGVQLEGNYWHIYGIKITGAADNGLYVTGNNNIIEYCTFEANRDTGCQISRRASSLSSISDWPSYNYIINCTSFNNNDPATGENADGFAAKLTCGPGNVFDGCISYNNVDDGWDLYAKSETGSIGVVTIRNCIAFRNGQTSSGVCTDESDGNGFKLGGDGVGSAHTISNCIAFSNKKHGITDNNNPDLASVTNCTSYGNGTGDSNGANFQLNRISSSTKATLKNLVGYKPTGTASDSFIGVMTNSVYYNSKKYYYVSSATTINKDKVGTVIDTPSTSIFSSTSIPAIGYDFHANWRNSDGTINTNNVLMPGSAAYSNMGASFGSQAGTLKGITIATN